MLTKLKIKRALGEELETQGSPQIAYIVWERTQNQIWDPVWNQARAQIAWEIQFQIEEAV